ncbi:MAG: hypothetical protein CBB71_07035 [Rhodopirellula sp. TMED11]|nr:MAG: hypothetical protein CBB71_07035 [Rhodopirellula sp. TMED11]
MIEVVPVLMNPLVFGDVWPRNLASARQTFGVGGLLAVPLESLVRWKSLVYWKSLVHWKSLVYWPPLN